MLQTVKQTILLLAFTGTVVMGMVLISTYQPYQIVSLWGITVDIEFPSQLLPLTILSAIFFGLLYLRTRE